jgi:threonine aldolase
VLDYELAMVAWFSGCVVRAIPTEHGLLSAEEVVRNIRPVSFNAAATGAVEVEQTHNMGGGTVYPMRTLCEIYDAAHQRGVRVHMDGARIFNASAALGIPVHEIASASDTVMFCLSKALGAPAGSMLAGPADLITKGRLYRKRLGGGMRQAGILAAAGLIALEDSPAGLPTDHANARFLAEGLARIPGIQVDAGLVESNIVVFDISASGLAPTDVSARLRERGVLINAINQRSLRAVTHYDVDRAQCAQAVEMVAESMAAGAAAGMTAAKPS